MTLLKLQKPLTEAQQILHNLVLPIFQISTCISIPHSIFSFFFETPKRKFVNERYKSMKGGEKIVYILVFLIEKFKKL